MNQFIFLAHAVDRIWFGTLSARSGDDCRRRVAEWLREEWGIEEEAVVRIELKGVTSKTFDVQESSL